MISRLLQIVLYVAVLTVLEVASIRQDLKKTRSQIAAGTRHLGAFA